MVLPMPFLEALSAIWFAYQIVPISWAIDMEVIEEGYTLRPVVACVTVCELLRVHLTDAGPKVDCRDALDFLMGIEIQ